MAKQVVIIKIYKGGLNVNTLIIYAHPWEGSFNYHVLDVVKTKLQEKGHTIDLIDLNKDGFNPVMRPVDLRYFGKGVYADPLAENYANRLKKAEEIIFIFPIWWYSEPAILKGFFDKVLLKGHTYEQVGQELRGMLKVKRSAVFTSGEITKEIFAYLGDPIQNVFINGTLKMVGIENTTWIHCPTVHDEAARSEYLDEVKAYL